ncbi:transporter [Leifsonia shinshuensis]|uniref:SLAC1 family transporter n=1 Tax=Leifsonia shinshuensis TaxID=150026 RepID=UPI00285863F8|nr:transporter [Leifsonia shinshuensis]MDR6972777.1 tellurite resistance protein [Leifsonia shinshuensis]
MAEKTTTEGEPVERIPLNTWAIAFGLAGLAKVWSTAAPAFGLAPAVAQTFWVFAAVAWLTLLAAHVVRGRRSTTTLIAQLRHPAQGPLAAIVPVSAILLGADLASWSLTAGRIVVLAGIAVAALFAGWLISTWLEGRLQLEAIHGGYLIPTVAAGFVASAAAERVGFDALAWACFGVGAVFWAVMMTLVLLRLTVAPALPNPLVPTMAILLAPPAVAGIAWLALHHSRIDGAADVLAGITGLMLLLQLALTARYLRAGFSLGAWSFTFPLAAAVGYAIEFTADDSGAIHMLVTAIGLIVVTALVALVSVLSVRASRLPTRGGVTPVAALALADDEDLVSPVVHSTIERR